MVSRAIWKRYTREFFKAIKIALVLRTRVILIVFKKLTRACFFQIALETMLVYTILYRVIFQLSISIL